MSYPGSGERGPWMGPGERGPASRALGWGPGVGRRMPARQASGRPARSLARHRMASNMAGVSLPVNVFCWLG